MRWLRGYANMKDNMKKIGSFVSDILIIVGVCLLLTQFIFFKGVVVGASMDRTLLDGQQLIVDKITYRVADPKRFDIVVVKFPREDSEWVKRVIGLPGEEVAYENNVLYINGEKIEEPFLTTGVVTKDFTSKDIIGTVDGVIPEGQYLVMGDNRMNSKDGRVMGTIAKENILGVARLRIFPLDKFGIL